MKISLKMRFLVAALSIFGISFHASAVETQTESLFILNGYCNAEASQLLEVNGIEGKSGVYLVVNESNGEFRYEDEVALMLFDKQDDAKRTCGILYELYSKGQKIELTVIKNAFKRRGLHKLVSFSPISNLTDSKNADFISNFSNKYFGK
jgi:hypothetical protein